MSTWVPPKFAKMGFGPIEMDVLLDTAKLPEHRRLSSTRTELESREEARSWLADQGLLHILRAEPGLSWFSDSWVLSSSGIELYEEYKKENAEAVARAVGPGPAGRTVTDRTGCPNDLRSESGPPYKVEQSGDFYVVRLTRDLEVGSSGKSIPGGTTLGTVNERGTISVRRSSGYVPRGYTEAAKSLLDAARIDLKNSGRIMAKERAREAAEEQKTGNFVVKIDDGPTLRAHDFKRAQTQAEKALLTRPLGTKARFYRALSGTTTREGIPWTLPFHVMEAYEWNGQKRFKQSSGA